MYALFLGLRSISPGDLHLLMEAEPIAVVDVNSRDSWLESHVPGSTNLDPENFKAKDLPTDKSATVVFYCSNFMCSKGPKAAKRARKFGYRNAIVMSAGMKGWLGANLPTQSGE